MAHQLTPHFSLEELTLSPTAQRLGLSNAADPPHVAALQHTAEGLERVRALLGGHPIHVDSAYRAPAVNAAVGGVPDSAHMQGHATDFLCEGYGEPYEIALFLATALPEAGIKWDQLIYEYGGGAGDWVHIAFQDETHGQRCELLTKRGPDDYIDGIRRI